MFPGGTGISDPISREAKWEVRHGESSDSRIVPEACRKAGDCASGGGVSWGRRLAEVVGRGDAVSE